MARFYHFGMEEKEDRAVGGVIGGFIKIGQNPDQAPLVQRPKAFGGGSEPLKKGAVTLSLQGWGWWQIGIGEYVDVPEAVPTKVVQNACPQLMTKAQAMNAGLVNEDGSLKRVPAPEQLEKPRKQQ